MSTRAEFEETQRLPLWIKAIVVLPVVAIGIPAVAAWADGAVVGGLVLTTLAGLFAVMAFPAFAIRLVTRVASGAVQLRIEPLRVPVPFMPPRENDIPVGDIERCESRPYRAFSDREFWGPHFWGLGTSSRGDGHLYLMTGRPFSARAVRLERTDGEKVLIGSARPGELAAAICRARLRDLLMTHGSPGGVAIAYKALERGLPLLGEEGEVSVRTAFGGPGARDAFEVALGAVSGGRYVVDPALARPELGVARERFVFILSHAGRSVTLVLREGYVTDEFIALARREERDVAEEQRLTVLKRELADRVMAEPAEAVYDVADAG